MLKSINLMSLYFLHLFGAFQQSLKHSVKAFLIKSHKGKHMWASAAQFNAVVVFLLRPVSLYIFGAAAFAK